MVNMASAKRPVLPLSARAEVPLLCAPGRSLSEKHTEVAVYAPDVSVAVQITRAEAVSLDRAQSLAHVGSVFADAPGLWPRRRVVGLHPRAPCGCAGLCHVLWPMSCAWM